jgi:2-polyprenyl-6-methoxyphenol hydroxylase-like FAD-dependent oxidoreductase
MIRRSRRASRQQGSFYYGDLWKYLFSSLQRTKVVFGCTVSKIDGSATNPIIDSTPYDMVVIADGGFSSLRQKYFTSDRPEYAGYVVWRGSINVNKLPAELVRKIKHIEGVYKSDICYTIVLKMAKDDGNDYWTFGTFIATPEGDLPKYWKKEVDGQSRHNVDSSAGDDDGDHYDDDDKSNDRNRRLVPSWFMEHMVHHFGDVPGFIELVGLTIKDGDVRPHPQYEFGASHVRNGRFLVVGDAAHMASPRTAVGAHTAVLDALELRRSLSRNDDLDDALQDYSVAGLNHVRELHERTKEVSRQFVPLDGGIDAIVSPEILYNKKRGNVRCGF